MSNKEAGSISFTEDRGFSCSCPKKAWVPDLCEQGIGPNPGPISVLSLNTAGSDNAFRAAKYYMQKRLGAIALPEVRFTDPQQLSMCCMASNFGYKAYSCVPQPTMYSNGAQQVHGGICLFIRRTLRQQLCATFACVQGQALCVDMDAFFICAVYVRPVQDQSAMHQWLTEACLAKQPRKQWMYLGD